MRKRGKIKAKIRIPKKKLLSVVIPAYKKGKTIRKDIDSIDKTLQEGLPADYDFEIICVEDGQFDNTREEFAKIKSKKARLITRKENKGKQ